MGRATPGALLAVALLTAACGGRMDQFDRAAWQAGAGNHDGDNPRAAMVGAAEAAGVRVGATRDQVRALLGTPDSSGPEADIWYLGRDSLSVDFRTLRVGYDGAGQVTAVVDRTK